MGLIGNRGDLLLFHRMAAETAEIIRTQGLSAIEWNRFGGSHSTLFGIIYALTTSEPYVLIPFQAGLHALAAVTLYRLIFSICQSQRLAIASIIPFSILPTPAFWYTQNHKEGLAILGFFLCLSCWATLADSKTYQTDSLRKFVLAISALFVSMGLLALSRTQLIEITYYLSLYGIVPLLLIIRINGAYQRRSSITSVLVFGVIATSLILFQNWANTQTGQLLTSSENYEFTKKMSQTTAPPSQIDPSIGEKDVASTPKKQSLHGIDPNTGTKVSKKKPEVMGPPSPLFPFRWEGTPSIPVSLDRKFFALNAVRAGYRRTAPFAHTSVGIEHMPKNAVESVLMVPHAWKVALFSPFPRHWSLREAKGASQIMRLVGAFEMLLAYLLFPFAVYFIYSYRKSERLWPILGLSFGTLTILGYVITNAGTLHRSRYGFMMVLVGMGAAGIIKSFSHLRHWQRKTGSTKKPFTNPGLSAANQTG